MGTLLMFLTLNKINEGAIIMYSLYHDYKKFEKIANRYTEESSYLDLSNEKFIAPTTMIPLLCLAVRKNITKFYVNTINEDYVERILNRKETSTTIPYQILPFSEKERQDNELSLKITEKINPIYGGLYTLLHLFSELTNNIYNHTPFEEELASQGYTYAQEYPNPKKLDLCVMDDGVGIPGRFQRSGIKYEDDCHAIEIAISNHSTVSEDKDVRGNGLWSTLKLVVEANKGQALIVSGQGCLHIRSKKRYKYYSLDNKNIFKGTLISLRLNNKEVQNFHDWIEFYRGNPYKYQRSD